MVRFESAKNLAKIVRNYPFVQFNDFGNIKDFLLVRYLFYNSVTLRFHDSVNSEHYNPRYDFMGFIRVPFLRLFWTLNISSNHIDLT